MVSIGANPITPFEIRRNSPLVTNSYPLSGGKSYAPIPFLEKTD